MISDRLQAYVRQCFDPADVEPILDLLLEAFWVEPEDTAEGIERIHAAVIFVADGDTQRFLYAVAMAQGDWRDVLVAARLAHAGWAERLKTVLG
ncbi:hypothetical protein [Actinoplanes sp. NPDC026670]|uniref:hypothetical protein n=1 Tax=Actinoplanes sp. NPDC026670 TaxID=3154700 RepID=UPI0033CCA131